MVKRIAAAVLMAIVGLTGAATVTAPAAHAQVDAWGL